MGYILLNQGDQYMTDCVRQFGEYSEQEVQVWTRCLQPDDVVLEVGACFGLHTVALSEAVPQGGVIAIEPQRFSFLTVCANLALNSITNVNPLRIALGSEIRRIRIPVLDPRQPQNFGCMPALGHEDGEEIMAVTIDSLGLGRLNFIKLDCEGNELQALKGASATLDRFKPYIYCEYTSNRQELLDLLGGLGYECVRHAPLHAPDLQPRIGSDMMLAVHKDTMARDFTQDSWNDFYYTHSFRPADTTDVLAPNTN